MPQAQEKTEQRSRHAKRWKDLCASGVYDDVLYKVETDGQGQVVTEPPPSLTHRRYQKVIIDLLDRELDGGEALYEPPVHTREGTKIPDVVWISYATLDREQDEDPPVPEICVEVLSPSNTEIEMLAKRDLYLEIGVREVWLCSLSGQLRFFDAAGERSASRMCPTLRPSIKLARS